MGSDGSHLTTWVPQDMKDRFSAVARFQGLSDSALLKRLVELMLNSTQPAGGVEDTRPSAYGAQAVRLSIRLRPEDQALLRERAAARGMAASTYVSVLTRAHLRGLSPLPKEELLAVKRAVAELGAIGRNLNRIARAANQGERVKGPDMEEARIMLRICEALRDHVKALLLANIKSWSSGHAGADR